MKLQREEEEKKAREHKEELDVRCNFQLFRRNIIPTQSQKGNRRKDLEREKKEKEAMEHKERLEVHREPYLLRQSTVLTPPQREDSTQGGYMHQTCSRLSSPRPF